jgi:hypothetical protein
MRERGYLLGAITIAWLSWASLCAAGPSSIESASEATLSRLQFKSNVSPGIAFNSLNRNQGIAKNLKGVAQAPPTLDLRAPEVIKANNDLLPEELRHTFSQTLGE